MRKMRGGAGKNVLLIIDPQNDFVKEGGALVVPGAVADIDRLCGYLSKNPNFFSEIHVSLDSHTMNHIGHAGFWETETNPYWGFKVVDGKIIHFDQANADAEQMTDVKAKKVKDVDLTLFAKTYIELMNDLPEGKTRTKPVPCRWPEHCIKDIIPEEVKDKNVNENGWEIVDNLRKQLNETINSTKRVFFHEKGTNDFVEMYSIFSAEVTYNDVLNKLKETNADYVKELEEHFPQYNVREAPLPKMAPFGKNRNYNYYTGFNIRLFKQLFGEPGVPNNVYICGEAKTHCVKTSIEDIYNTITENKEKRTGVLIEAGYKAEQLADLIQRIHIIDNATSPITFPPIFIEPMKKSFLEMSRNGVKIYNINDASMVDLNEDQIKELYGIEETVPTTNNV